MKRGREPPHDRWQLEPPWARRKRERRTRRRRLSDQGWGAPGGRGWRTPDANWWEGRRNPSLWTCLSGGVNRLDRECMEKKSESGMLEKARSYFWWFLRSASTFWNRFFQPSIHPAVWMGNFDPSICTMHIMNHESCETNPAIFFLFSYGHTFHCPKCFQRSAFSIFKSACSVCSPADKKIGGVRRKERNIPKTEE